MMPEYDINKPWLTLDQFQKDYIAEDGNCFVCCGRQSGKSTACGIKIIEKAIREPKPCDYLVIALTERQAYALFFKALLYCQTRYPQFIKGGKDKPTMHEINLKNGVCIMCYACGNTGWGLTGLTIKKMFVDECAGMNRQIFQSITPMLSVTGGSLDLLSTPKGKEGYFYEASMRDDFRKFYVSAEDCPRHDKAFLDAEKRSMSKLEYAQEYRALFLDDLKRIFGDELLNRVCTLKTRTNIRQGRYYLGVDVGGLGEDASTFEIIEKIDKEHFEQVENITTSRTLTTQTTDKILSLENLYNFKSIAIDNAGLGAGVFHPLLREQKTKSKVVGLMNAQKNLDRDGKKKATLMKEDLYMNLLSMMEHKRLKLLDDDEVRASLASCQYEYITETGKKTKMRIFGNNTHIAEGLTRAIWVAVEDKHLNLFAY